LSAGVASSGGVGVGNGPSIGGQRPRNNSFNIEAWDNNRKDVAGPNVSCRTKPHRNFTLLQNQFAPEFGHSSGGQFNLVAKSGTNQVHGSLYEYMLNRNFNAVDQSNANQGVYSTPASIRTGSAGSIGGPLVEKSCSTSATWNTNRSGAPVFRLLRSSRRPPPGIRRFPASRALSSTNLNVLKQFLPSAASASDSTTVWSEIPIGVTPVVAPNFTNQYTYVAPSISRIRKRISGADGTSITTSRHRQPRRSFPFLRRKPTKSYLFTLAEYHTSRPT